MLKTLPTLQSNKTKMFGVKTETERIQGIQSKHSRYGHPRFLRISASTGRTLDQQAVIRTYIPAQLSRNAS